MLISIGLYDSKNIHKNGSSVQNKQYARTENRAAYTAFSFSLHFNGTTFSLPLIVVTLTAQLQNQKVLSHL